MPSRTLNSDGTLSSALTTTASDTDSTIAFINGTAMAMSVDVTIPSGAPTDWEPFTVYLGHGESFAFISGADTDFQVVVAPLHTSTGYDTPANQDKLSDILPVFSSAVEGPSQQTGARVFFEAT